MKKFALLLVIAGALPMLGGQYVVDLEKIKPVLKQCKESEVFVSQYELEYEVVISVYSGREIETNQPRGLINTGKCVVGEPQKDANGYLILKCKAGELAASQYLTGDSNQLHLECVTIEEFLKEKIDYGQ